MCSLNLITIIGKVVGKVFYFNTEPSAADLVRFTIQTTDSRAAEAEPEKHECMAWGPIGLELHRHLNQNSELAIRGSLKYHCFKDPDGRPRRIPEIHVNHFTFLGN